MINRREVSNGTIPHKKVNRPENTSVFNLFYLRSVVSSPRLPSPPLLFPTPPLPSCSPPLPSPPFPPSPPLIFSSSPPLLFPSSSSFSPPQNPLIIKSEWHKSQLVNRNVWGRCLESLFSFYLWKFYHYRQSCLNDKRDQKRPRSCWG